MLEGSTADFEKAAVMSAFRKRTLAVASNDGRGVVGFWVERKDWIHAVDGSAEKALASWDVR